MYAPSMWKRFRGVPVVVLVAWNLASCDLTAKKAAAPVPETEQLVSRAFDHDQFGPFCAELAALAGMDMVLPMVTGAEAVETAIKTARKWGYEVKGVPADEAVIVAFE